MSPWNWLFCTKVFKRAAKFQVLSRIVEKSQQQKIYDREVDRYTGRKQGEREREKGKE